MESLRSNCNLLIAFGSLSDIFHQSAHFILAYYIYTARNFITLSHCYWIQWAQAFMMNFGSFIVLSIGVDRFYSVLKPTSYQNLKPNLYLPFMLSFPIAFSLFLQYIGYLAVLADPNAPVICVIAEVYHARAKNIWSIAMLMVNSMILVVYIGVWILIWKKSGERGVDHRIMRSLTAIMALTLLGAFLTFLVLSIGVMLGLDEEEFFKLHLNVGWTVNFSIAMNYPVYMILSKEYRRAFLEQLSILSCGLFKKFETNKVSSLAITHNPSVATKYAA